MGIARRLRIGTALLMAVTTAGVSSTILAAATISEVLQDTQKQSEVKNLVRMVWWLPEEYWRVSWESNDIAPEQQEIFLKTVRPYLVVAVVDGTLGPFGGIEFTGADALRGMVRVIDRNSTPYAPLPDEKLSGDVKNLASFLKSMFGNMLGAMGEGIEIFFFPATTEAGMTIAAATEEGEFSVEVAGEVFRWRLPIGSMIPPKVCPEDGESMNGAWKFCPWHGKPLETVDEPGKNLP